MFARVGATPREPGAVLVPAGLPPPTRTVALQLHFRGSMEVLGGARRLRPAGRPGERRGRGRGWPLPPGSRQLDALGLGCGRPRCGLPSRGHGEAGQEKQERYRGAGEGEALGPGLPRVPAAEWGRRAFTGPPFGVQPRALTNGRPR